uniref:Secreted protein n=1 Tax=Globodera rostochiensis TaxID=31243 RepID=A0A914I6A3_GLORO
MLASACRFIVVHLLLLLLMASLGIGTLSAGKLNAVFFNRSTNPIAPQARNAASSRRRYNAECFFTPVNCHQFVRRTVFVTRPLLINSSTTATPKTTTADHFQRRRKGTHRKRTKHFRHKYV